MFKLVKFLKPYTLQLIILVILLYILVQTNLALPDYLANIVNKGIVLKDNAYIWQTGERMLGVALLGAVVTVIIGYLAARIATGFSMNIREAVFSKVESFSLAEFNKFSTASLITRSTNDIQQIQLVFFLTLRMVLMAPIMGVGAIIRAYNNAPSMTWIIALAVIVMMIIIITLFTVAMPKFKLLQKLVDRLNLVTRENLTGLRVIRAFRNEKFEEEKFEKVNLDLTAANLFVNRLMVVAQPIMMLLMNLTVILIIWVGAHRIDAGSLSIGGMLAFMQYSMQVIMSFLMFSIIMIMFPRASVSMERVAEVISTNITIKDAEKPEKPSKSNGEVEFKNVTFAYPTADTPVIENISFTAKPGETTAFVGSTGSGKSTLINLIPRFYDVSQGEVLVDGVNVKNYKLNDLYAKIGYVPQKGALFSGTVASNIGYGAPDANEQALNKAAEIAQADEFIKTLPEKMDNSIAQGGSNVSGGQKQRLSIARAIAKNPEIFIFDDSFSALDFKTDAALRKALNKETKNKTVLIVAQRLSSIMDADQIIVLDEGKIVGRGTHESLIESCKVYQEIASSQLSEEELKTTMSSSTRKVDSSTAPRSRIHTNTEIATTYSPKANGSRNDNQEVA